MRTIIHAAIAAASLVVVAAPASAQTYYSREKLKGLKAPAATAAAPKPGTATCSGGKNLTALVSDNGAFFVGTYPARPAALSACETAAASTLQQAKDMKLSYNYGCNISEISANSFQVTAVVAQTGTRFEMLDLSGNPGYNGLSAYVCTLH